MIWCRFEVAGEINYGIVEGDRVTQAVSYTHLTLPTILLV